MTPRPELAPMFFEMLGERQAMKIVQVIVQRVPVLVVNHGAIRNGAVRTFPDQDSPELPDIRGGYLDEDALVAIVGATLALLAYWCSLRSSVARLKFGLWRKVQASHALVPSRVTILKGVSGPQAGAVAITPGGGLRLSAPASVGLFRPPFCFVRCRAEASGCRSVGAHRKGDSAKLAYAFDHNSASRATRRNRQYSPALPLGRRFFLTWTCGRSAGSFFWGRRRPDQ